MKAQLSALFEPLQRAISSQSALEQKLLLACIAFCLALLCIVTVWHSQQSLQGSTKSLQEAESALAWMKAQAHKINAIKAIDSLAPTDPRSLLSIATQAATGAGITIARYQPDKNKQLRMWLEATDYASLMAWLVELRKTTGVRVNAMTLQNSGTPGLVNASIVLLRNDSV